MQFIPLVELSRRTLVGKSQARGAIAAPDRLMELSSWMMVLATIRLVCTIADYGSAFLESMQSNLQFGRIVGKFLQDSQFFLSFGTVWPLVLAVALRKTRWPELLRAATATFLILSICGVLEFAALWAHTRGSVLNVGSFHIPRRPLGSLFFSEVVLGLLGATQVALEFGVAVWSILLSAQLRRSAPPDSSKQFAARRALFGRLALCVSLAFFVLVIRGSVWSAYLEILNQSSLVREFVLRNDVNRGRVRRSRPRSLEEIEQERQARDMQAMLGAGGQAWQEGRFAKAKESYLQLISLVESVPSDRWTPGARYTVSNAFNNLGWLLATCADSKFRDPQGAVKYAKRAVDFGPRDGNCWNTLGVAYYRAGHLEDAKNALYRSMELRNEGDGFDWFFLALVHFKLGHKDRAREWYDRAADRLQRVPQVGFSLPLNQLNELYRFEVEAAEAIGLPKPAPPTGMRNSIRWTGAEVIGVPIPATPPTGRWLSPLRRAALLSSPFRMEQRTPRGLLMPASPQQQGRGAAAPQ
ncbi:MAG: tetratricopeptide repeat protein [Isosphaeraceae bacterium]